MCVFACGTEEGLRVVEGESWHAHVCKVAAAAVVAAGVAAVDTGAAADAGAAAVGRRNGSLDGCGDTGSTRLRVNDGWQRWRKPSCVCFGRAHRWFLAGAPASEQTAGVRSHIIMGKVAMIEIVSASMRAHTGLWVLLQK